MYFWNKKALEEKLIADSLTEREKFSYLFAFIFSYALGTSISIFFPEEVSEIAVIGQVFILLLTAIGIIGCFRINQSGDGKKFVERFISMGWIIAVRVVLICFAVVFAISIIFSLVDSDRFQESLEGPSIVWDVLFGGVVTVIYYWRLAVSIAVIAHTNQTVES